MDYISRELATEAVIKAGGWSSTLDNVPSADVVEVIRCKDCIYSVYPILSSQMKCNKDGERWVFFDGYCDKAERRG